MADERPPIDFGARRRPAFSFTIPVPAPENGQEYGDWYDDDSGMGTFVLPSVLTVRELGDLATVEAEIQDALAAGGGQGNLLAAQHALNYLVRKQAPDAPTLELSLSEIAQLLTEAVGGDGRSAITEVLEAVAIARGMQEQEQPEPDEATENAVPLESTSRKPSPGSSTKSRSVSASARRKSSTTGSGPTSSPALPTEPQPATKG